MLVELKSFYGDCFTASQYNGPLTGYRIADSRFPIFDGTGAALLGGRWNSPGKRVIYGSLTFAGALLEQLARASTHDLPSTLHWVSFHINDDLLIESVDVEEIKGWQENESVAAQEYGDTWLDSVRSVALIVPSVVGQPIEQNVLINPAHPDFSAIAVDKPQQVIWDKRLTK